MSGVTWSELLEVEVLKQGARSGSSWPSRTEKNEGSGPGRGPSDNKVTVGHAWCPQTGTQDGTKVPIQTKFRLWIQTR